MQAFLTVFATLFLAELGDKTQLAILAFSTGPSSSWTVFVAASLALVASAALAVMLGDALGSLVPTEWLRVGAAVLFLVIGVIVLIDSLPKALRS
ncbi:MAG: TMEM165/GDT1 family protein [Actinomycetota bacterium]|nr:TMEM165/GDT1 family protein [Actinomycetota bacterium]